MTEDHDDNEDEGGNQSASGECPFCGVTGYIPGADWQGECPHWVGVDDDFRGSDPVYLLTEGEPFDTFREDVAAFDDLTKAKRKASLRSIPEDVAQLIEAALEENWGEAYWKKFVDYSELEADIDETLFSTTYRSYFVADKGSARETLGVLVKAAIEHMKAKGLGPASN